ncbi:hypothetical protein ACFOX2_00305 [Corynebacterium marambiense]|uniref:hypothetical protein n=1 Tax=Corynebacterium marambiense TaxID=2765364 RepID=UPI002260929A|nr:hypothetical protein [Corynebacterium marambiense]MCX7543526.1 hypothetical protein [Corynebacterium marambiense]
MGTLTVPAGRRTPAWLATAGECAPAEDLDRASALRRDGAVDSPDAQGVRGGGCS